MMFDNLVGFIRNGSITFPKLLFQHYRTLGITDAQFLVLLHLHVFAEDGKHFPTIQELEERMELSAAQIILQFQSLLKAGMLSIEQDFDKWGKVTERYNLNPLYEKLGQLIFPTEKIADDLGQKINNSQEKVPDNLFIRFEQEFGRPLSPLEYESLIQWLDQDHYNEELILTALQEASISGALNMRYIDRILLEWSRNQIRTEEEAKAFSARFREKQFERKAKFQKGKTAQEVEEIRFPQFNWLEHKS